MKKPNHTIIANIISIVLFILIVIGVVLIAIDEAKEESQVQETQVQEITKEESPVQEITETEIPVQEIQNETNLYNQIVENEYEGMIYYTESRFDTNNLYLPTKEVNPTSGKSGLCGLQNSTNNDVWSQDKLCEDYMSNRYGSWEAAWEFHEQNGWW